MASPSWCGRSAKAANARARSTLSSWEARTCRAEVPVETLKIAVVAVAVVYAAIVGVVWLAQESLIFHPQPPAPIPHAPPGWRIEQVTLQARDGTRLEGVLALPDAPRPALVIYFGGNGEEVTSYAPEAPADYGKRAALFVNYRGYGRSGGRPSEKALVSDAMEVFDWAAKRTDIDAARIAVHGRSLGTGVAVQVASARPARCVVLTSPFSSARELASEIYPWLPVKLVLRHPFDSAARAPAMRIPALVIMADADTVIPMRHSERLASLWGGEAQRLVLHGFGHNDLQADPRYAPAIRAFLDRCLG